MGLYAKRGLRPIVRRFTLLGLTTMVLWAWTAFPPSVMSGSLSVPHVKGAIKSRTVSQKTQKRRKTTLSQAPAVVQDLRIQSYPDHNRLVLDLQRSVIFTQSRQRHPDRVVIELQNSLLGKIARARLADEPIPEEMVIAQATPRSVTLSLNLNAISDYKLLPLSNPHRLVLDVFSRARVAAVRTAETSDALPQARPGQGPPSARPGPRPAREIKTIVIDPGHGGKDPGALGRSGAVEKHITLRVGLLLRDLIAKHMGTQVLMTRDRDVFVELEDRAKFANSKEADLFVSIHVNSHPQRATKGLEIYHFGEASDPRALEVAARENGTPIDDTGVGWQYLVADLLTTKKIEESLEFAWTTRQSMVAYLDNHYDVVDHGVKTAPFYVLRFTTMPSILAEIGYISNPNEERLLQGDMFLIRTAQALFEGIKTFVKPLQTASRGGVKG